MREPHREPEVAQLGEFVRRVVARHRQVAVGRAEVLAERQDVHVAPAEVPHADQHLVPLLAHAEDDAALGERVRDHPAGVGEQRQGAVVPPARARQAVQPLGGLEVVIEDVGPGVQHDPQRALGALEIGDQHLDRGVGQPPLDLA